MSQILVVCTANVCRSPFASAILSNRLAAVGGLEVASAGSRARYGDVICDLVDNNLGPDERAHPHRARRLDEASIRNAELILTAELDHRSAVAKLLPSSTNRTFTVLEFRRLAAVVDDARSRRGSHAGSSRPDSLVELVSRVNGARGLAPMVEVRFPWMPRRPRTTLDISDGHTMGNRAHERTIAEIRESATAIGDWIAEHLA